MLNIQNEISAVVAIDIVAISFMAGVYIHTLKTLKENQKQQAETHKAALEQLKQVYTEQIEALKEHVLDRMANFKEYVKDHITRLEVKQDKHNNLIERMAIVEQSVKSAHHREDTTTYRLDKLESELKD